MFKLRLCTFYFLYFVTVIIMHSGALIYMENAICDQTFSSDETTMFIGGDLTTCSNDKHYNWWLLPISLQKDNTNLSKTDTLLATLSVRLKSWSVLKFIKQIKTVFFLFTQCTSTITDVKRIINIRWFNLDNRTRCDGRI